MAYHTYTDNQGIKKVVLVLRLREVIKDIKTNKIKLLTPINLKQ